MMTPKQLIDLCTLVNLFRDSLVARKQLKCLDSVQMIYHSGWASTKHDSSSAKGEMIREALLKANEIELLKKRDELYAAGVDVIEEWPTDLHQKAELEDAIEVERQLTNLERKRC